MGDFALGGAGVEGFEDLEAFGDGVEFLGCEDVGEEVFHFLGILDGGEERVEFFVMFIWWRHGIEWLEI